MSAPQTNIETQKRRHRGPLVGMALVVVFGAGLIIYWIFEEFAGAENPVGSDVQDGQVPNTASEDADAVDPATPAGVPSASGPPPAPGAGQEPAPSD